MSLAHMMYVLTIGNEICIQVDKLIYDIDIHFVDSDQQRKMKVTHILDVQESMALYFQENLNSKTIPPFVHNMRLRSSCTAKELIRFCAQSPLIREFSIERIETVLDDVVRGECLYNSGFRGYNHGIEVRI